MQEFGDPRLYQYWTKSPLNETIWVDLGNGNSTWQYRNESLWTMGNK